MIELRWRVFAGERTLQYRAIEGAYMDAGGALSVAGASWGPWKDVPEFAPTAREVIEELA